MPQSMGEGITLLPEIEEYFAAENDYDPEYERRLEEVYRNNPVPRWSNSWNAEERAAYYEADAKRKAAELELQHYKRERKAVALEKLKNSDDKLINWLMNDRNINRNYTGHRDVVLKALPLTREEMESFGDGQGWCGEYAQLLAEADQAGVLPAPLPELADIDALVADFRRWYGGNSRRFRTTINKHMPAIIASYEERKAEREKAEAEAAAEAARAESTTKGNTKSATTATGRTRTTVPA